MKVKILFLLFSVFFHQIQQTRLFVAAGVSEAAATEDSVDLAGGAGAVGTTKTPTADPLPTEGAIGLFLSYSFSI
jgi:hypothetical protein